MTLLSKHKLTLIGILLGSIGGYLYYALIGCNSGTCAITSNPLMSTLYGGMMGGLIANLFKKDNKSTLQKQENEAKTNY